MTQSDVLKLRAAVMDSKLRRGRYCKKVSDSHDLRVLRQGQSVVEPSVVRKVVAAADVSPMQLLIQGDIPSSLISPPMSAIRPLKYIPTSTCILMENRRVLVASGPQGWLWQSQRGGQRLRRKAHSQPGSACDSEICLGLDKRLARPSDKIRKHIAGVKCGGETVEVTAAGDLRSEVELRLSAAVT